VGGVRAYASARRGRPLDLAPVPVRVHAWTVHERRGADLDVTVACGGGTYVRALARDLGRATGSAAHLVSLRRTRAGRFDVGAASTLAHLCQGEMLLHPLREAVAHLPAQPLSVDEARLASHGRSVPARLPGDIAALVEGDVLVAVGVRHDDVWQPRVVVRDA
ncbi:MAG: tRNA pseudouridine(55) synthase TruB, partial [Gemmatimonadaceae bacterium]